MKFLLPLSLILLTTSLPTAAQQLTSLDKLHKLQEQATKEATEFDHIYTFVERMPQAVGKNGTQAIAMEFLSKLRVESFPLEEYDKWQRPFVFFIVGPNGNICHVKMLVSSNIPTVDRAMIKAVYSLPKLTPGYQAGKAVAVSFMFPLNCLKPQ